MGIGTELQRGLELFDLEAFRPGQARAVELIHEGREALVVMPTGSGKSLCFQLPAMLSSGLTLCISPLIALMKDQVDALEALGLPATCLNSHLSAKERRDRRAAVGAGEIRLLYVAPERLDQRPFRQMLRNVEVSRLVIDEAHCVSQWGHDFRPDYLKISTLRRELGNPPVAALTATATHAVQRDILEQLSMTDAEVLVHGFERPNLSFRVENVLGDDEKAEAMSRIVRKASPGSVVVYCATRKETDRVVAALQNAGIAADRYHGGMSEAMRSRTQDRWMAGEVRVLAATNAFGMGVDKPDVRAIIHHNIPGSVEAYYQEAGRAGRDGRPADCVVLYELGDRGIHDFFIRNTYPDAKWYERLWADLLQRPQPTVSFDVQRMCRTLSSDGSWLHQMALDAILRKLTSAGHIRSLRQRRSRRELEVADDEPLRIDFAALGRRRKTSERQLADMIAWAEGSGCRQAQLVRYFNSEPSFGERCGVCDHCERTAAKADVSILVQRVLSGVARGRGRASRKAIVAMLCGRASQGVEALELNTAPTFGVLATLREETVAELLAACERGGLVEGRRMRGRRLTAAGADVMAGESVVDDKTVKGVRRALRKARR